MSPGRVGSLFQGEYLIRSGLDALGGKEWRVEIYRGFDKDGIPLPLPRVSTGERGRVRGIPEYG
ncbi:MAG: hypothetical protein AMJ94_12300 [Deltaproteobacteria bacterium SM23_61]|nr:MAG: hypothetical protein AMJ94_12300 [Deltaproteobacteria bacterium SM23_61]